MRQPHRQRVFLRTGVAVVAALLMASCSASVSTSTDGPSTTKAAATTEVPTTTEPSKSITEADLEALLPSAADVGSDYEVDDSGDDDDSSTDDEVEAAMKKACPDLAALLSDFGDTMAVALRDGPADVERNFATDDSRQIDVELDTDTDSGPTEKQVEQVVAAAQKCKTFDVPNADIGGKMAITLGIRADDTYGDFGMVMAMRMQMTGDVLPAPVSIEAYFVGFRNGDVNVSVSGVGGLDSSTFEAIPPDTDIVKRLAEDLDGQVSDLQGS